MTREEYYKAANEANDAINNARHVLTMCKIQSKNGIFDDVAAALDSASENLVKAVGTYQEGASND